MMFRLRQHDDVHVETTDIPGVLDIQRVGGGATRWSHRVNVAAAYAQRFTTPEAFAIDARLGAHDEVYVIAHAFERSTRKLLPPRELCLTDGQLDRSRPGADRHALEANEHVIAGGIHWEVTDETATTFTLAGGRSIEKSEATGPFLRLARYRDWMIRIVQELDDHVLAVIAGPAARKLGWSTGLTPSTADVGFRWFERDELGHLARPVGGTPCATCATARGEHAPGFNTIAVERAEERDERLVACSACNRLWVVTQSADGWQWTLADEEGAASVPAPPPEPEPTPAPVSSTDGKVRLSIASGERLLDVESETATTFTLLDSDDTRDDALVAAGFTVKEICQGGSWVNDYETSVRYEHRLVIDRTDPRLARSRVDAPVFDARPRVDEPVFDARPRVDAPVFDARTSGKPPTDEALEEYRVLEIAGHRPAIITETATTWTASIDRDGVDPALEAAGFTLQPDLDPDSIVPRFHYLAQLDKLDKRVSGPFLFCVRFAGHILRAIEDDGDRLLLICRPEIGDAVGFHRRDQLWFRWVLKKGLEELRVPRDTRVEVDHAPLIDASRVAQNNAEVTFLRTQLAVSGETADELVLRLESDYSHDDLVEAGFTREKHESDRDRSGRQMHPYYEGLREYYTFHGVVPKLDPRLSGPYLRWGRWNGEPLRIAAERGEHLLVVAAATRPGFTIAGGVYWRWVPRPDVADEDPRAAAPLVVATTPVVVERVSADRPEQPETPPDPTHEWLDEFLTLEIAGYRAWVDYETADRWSLAITRDTDDPRVPRDFTREPDDPRMGARIEARYSASLDKVDPRITGPFLYCVRFAGHILRAIDEMREHVLLVCSSDLAGKLEFQRRERIAFRWVKKTDVEVLHVRRSARVPPVDAPLHVVPFTIERIDACATFEIRGCPVDPTVKRETPDLIVLEHTSADPIDELVRAGFDDFLEYDERGGREWHVYTLETEKTDPRLGFDLVEYRGYHLRVISRDVDSVGVVAHRDLAGVLGFAVSPRVAYKSLPLSAIRPAEARVRSLDTIPNLDKLPTLGYAPRGELFSVITETPTTITLDSVGEVMKPDLLYSRAVIGWVRYRGAVLRVVEDKPDAHLVVAHADLRERLRLVDFGAVCCAWIPAAEAERIAVTKVTPEEPDVGRLAAVAHRVGAHDRLVVRGIPEPLRILRETATTFELEQIGAIAKRDDRLAGPFSDIARASGFELRIALEHAGWQLAVVHPSLPLPCKMLHLATVPDANFRWFEARSIEKLSRLTRPSAEDLSVLGQIEVTIDGTVHRCLLKAESADCFDVVLDGADLRIDKLDVRVGGFERLGTWQDMLVRVVGEREGKSMLVVDSTFTGRKPGWESAPAGMMWRLVDPHEVTMPRPTNETLYHCQRVLLAGRERGVQVLDETADSFILEMGPILKTDISLIGPYGRLVLLAGNLLRVAEERYGQFLVIAHGQLGASLGFTSYTYDGHTLGWAWFRPSELDAV